jgi:protein SCO1/2
MLVPGWFKAAVMCGVAALLITPAPPVRAAQPPQLIDQTGRRFTLDQLRGTPLVVAFVATRCTSACPLINARFARAQDVFAQQHMNARLLTITLDPKHDSPAVMRRLAKRFGADPKRWLVASGSVSDVTRIMNAFGVAAREGADGVPDEHTTFVYVFDRNGVLRERIFASSTLEDQLAQDLRAMARR